MNTKEYDRVMMAFRDIENGMWELSAHPDYFVAELFKEEAIKYSQMRQKFMRMVAAENGKLRPDSDRS